MGERRSRNNVELTEFWETLQALPIEIEQDSLEQCSTSISDLARTHNLSAYEASYLDLVLRRSLGMLAQIPFETLIVEEQPVNAQHEISYVQSLSVLALLKAREQAYQSLTGRDTLLTMGAAPRYHLPGNRPKTCNQPTRAL